MNDADLETKRMKEKADRESYLREAGMCPHGWLKARIDGSLFCGYCGKNFEDFEAMEEERLERLEE